MKMTKMIIATAVSLTGFLLAATVDNGLLPESKAVKLVLEENLRFGGELDDENSLWVGVNTSISVDGKGNIYIADTKESRVLEFDGQGEFIRQVAGPGLGPGEFQNLLTFTILADGSAVGHQALGPQVAIKYFDAAMQPGDVITPNFSQLLPQAILPNPTGNLFEGFLLTLDPVNNRMGFIFGVMDKELKLVHEVAKKERGTPDIQRFGESEYWVEYLAENFTLIGSKNGHMAFDNKGAIYTARSDRYEVVKWSPNFQEKALVVNKKYKPLPNTEADIQGLIEPVRANIVENLPPNFQQIITANVVRRAVEKADFPPVKEPINGIIPLESGGFLVVRDNNLTDKNAYVDIFSAEGHFQGEGVIPGVARVNFDLNPFVTFKHGYLYTVIENESGDMQVVRYTPKFQAVP